MPVRVSPLVLLVPVACVALLVGCAMTGDEGSDDARTDARHGDAASGSDAPAPIDDVTQPSDDAAMGDDGSSGMADVETESDVVSIPADACVPNCAGRACGSDGCGGSCGTCASGHTCDVAGACQPSLPECPCWAGECPSCYCGSSVSSYASSHGCMVPEVSGHDGDLMSCTGGRWSVGTTCSSHMCIVAPPGTADTCVASGPTGGDHHLWIAFDSSVAGSRTHTEAYFQCILGHTDFNTLATGYSTGRALSFGGVATLGHSCSFVHSTSATIANDTSTFDCVQSQTGWPIANDDVILYYPTWSSCQDGRNHWHIPVSGGGHSASVEIALGFTGSSANCQTALGTHEVFEAAAEARAADCCNGQDGCTATPGAFGWYSLSACGATWTAQAVSPAGHEFTASYCARLH